MTSSSPSGSWYHPSLSRFIQVRDPPLCVTSFMSPVSLVFHTIVAWDWSQRNNWNKTSSLLHEMSMLQQASVLFTCLLSSYATQTNITPPFANSPLLLSNKEHQKLKGLTLNSSSFFGNLIDLENQVTGCSLMLSHLPLTKSQNFIGNIYECSLRGC